MSATLMAIQLMALGDVLAMRRTRKHRTIESQIVTKLASMRYIE